MLDSQGNIKVLSRRKALLETYVWLASHSLIVIPRQCLTVLLVWYDSKKKKTKKNDGDGGASDSESDEEEEAERQAQLLLEMQRKEADFDVRRYFQSILSADTIKMYCFLLSSYRENSAKVNHYIHSFFYRAKHFKIYQHEEWTMQPLLFNIHVLLLFNRMLQDPVIQKQADFKSFLDFIRGVVRDYFTLAEKNHLLFVESLLRQPYAAKSALLLQKNYEPQDSMAKSRSEAVALGRERKIALINEVRRQKRAIDAEELEGEEEFQFTLGPSDFQASSLVATDKRGKSSNAGGDGESDEEAEFGGLEQPASANSTDGATSAAPTKKKRTKIVSDRAKTWTKVEDRYLEKMYRMYRHLPSVYEVISYEDMFQDRDRTPEQIERRVKYLKLHRKTHDSSDEDEKKSDDERGDDLDLDLDADMSARPSEVQESSRPRRRLRRVTRLSDDSDSDDDLLETGSKTKKSSPLDEDGGAPDVSSAADRDGAEDESMDDVQDTELLADDEVPGRSAARIDATDAIDANSDTQMMEATDDGDDGVDATQPIDRDDLTQDVDDEPTQAIDEDAESSADEQLASSATETGSELILSNVDEANDIDTTQAFEDAETAHREAPIVVEEEGTVASNKRARDPTDDDASSGDVSPQKKVSRSAPANTDETQEAAAAAGVLHED